MNNTRLSLAFRDLEEIPEHVINNYRDIIELDLSFNSLKNIKPLSTFKNLNILVLDNNNITSHSYFPKFPNLHTLWVNKNSIDNLTVFIDKLVHSCPQLKHLSMLGNAACPNYFNGGTPKEYRDYRLYVIYRLKKLEVLDSSPVTEEEIAESERIYGVLPQVTSENIQSHEDIDNKKLNKLQSIENMRSKKYEKKILAEKEQRRKKRRNISQNFEQIKSIGSNDIKSQDENNDTETNIENEDTKPDTEPTIIEKGDATLSIHEQLMRQLSLRNSKLSQKEEFDDE